MKSISVIIPTLNEQQNIQALLSLLQPFRGRIAELIVVDGGSTDSSCEVAESLSDHLIQSERGRARQMNAGAEIAGGKFLWFLHADSIPSNQVIEKLQRIADSDEPVWGRFDVKLSGGHVLLKLTEVLMNMRSRWTGIATGDQGIFIHRKLFDEVGGFPDIPLMEDISISGSLKKIKKPVCCSERLVTSSRRWEQNGILRTIFLVWWLRLAFALGRSPQRLYQQYYR